MAPSKRRVRFDRPASNRTRHHGTIPKANDFDREAAIGMVPGRSRRGTLPFNAIYTRLSSWLAPDSKGLAI